MSNLQKINGKVVDVDEPVKTGVYLSQITWLKEELVRLKRKATDAFNLAQSIDDRFGRWVGELDLKVGEHHKRLPLIETKVSDDSYRLSKLEQRVTELERRLDEIGKS